MSRALCSKCPHSIDTDAEEWTEVDGEYICEMCTEAEDG